MSAPIFILGLHQTDFAHHFSRAGGGLFDIMSAAVTGALEDASLQPRDIQVGHVGNFTGELFSGQGHLGGLFASLHPDLDGVPSARHEAACASGSVAALSALSDLAAGHYEVACVVGLEQMRNVSGERAAEFLGAAAWAGREATDARYAWPHLFDRIAAEYDKRHGLRQEHLAAIARKNFDNARRNPHAQTRGWRFEDACFVEDDAKNPVVEGRIRRHDCSQITDGAAAVVLASEGFARDHAARLGLRLEQLPRIAGWGHRTATMLLEDKLQGRAGVPWMFPRLREAIEQARARAGLAVQEVDAFEVHDCFTITEYVLLEHLGLAAAGEAFRAVESGQLLLGGRTPVNPSGGLIGVGHPVGATGVRMLADAARQVRGTAFDYQVPGARAVQTVNIGGSATTAVSFVVCGEPR